MPGFKDRSTAQHTLPLVPIPQVAAIFQCVARFSERARFAEQILRCRESDFRSQGKPMISYLKVPPTTYVLHYSGGKVKRQGAGLSYFYFAPSAEIVLVPLTSTDVPFVFNEVSADFQDATIQGELTYRITDAKRVAEVLDYSVDSRQKYRSEDPTKLGDRLVNSAQILARSFTQKRPLAEVLISSDLLVAETLAGLQQSPTVEMLGIEVLALSILSIKPTPEMSKALQADARESLLRRADEVIQ